MDLRPRLLDLQWTQSTHWTRAERGGRMLLFTSGSQEACVCCPTLHMMDGLVLDN